MDFLQCIPVEEAEYLWPITEDHVGAVIQILDSDDKPALAMVCVDPEYPREPLVFFLTGPHVGKQNTRPDGFPALPSAAVRADKAVHLSIEAPVTRETGQVAFGSVYAIRSDDGSVTLAVAVSRIGTMRGELDFASVGIRGRGRLGFGGSSRNRKHVGKLFVEASQP